MRIDSSSLSGFRFGWGRARLSTKKSYTKNCIIMFCHVREKIVPDVGASFLQDVVVVRKAYDNRCSQAVPHPSTILARRCLTAVIGREQVCSSWYGRRQRTNLFGKTHSSSSFSLHSTSVSMPPEEALPRNTAMAQIKNIKLQIVTDIKVSALISVVVSGAVDGGSGVRHNIEEVH